MLMSAYVNEQLTIKEGLFKNSAVTPAARPMTHGCLGRAPRLLHARTVAAVSFAHIDHIQCGQLECDRTTDDFQARIWVCIR